MGRNKGFTRVSRYLIVFFLAIGGGSFLVACGRHEASKPIPIRREAVAISAKLKKKSQPHAKPFPPTQEKTLQKKKTSSGLPKLEEVKIQQVHYKPDFSKVRDPFIPFINFSAKLSATRRTKPLLPLQKYALSQLKLIAVIDAGDKGRWAMVSDPSGKGYTVRKGVPIGSKGGVVQKILMDRIIVKQVKIDLLGRKRIHLVTLKLRLEKQGE